ncbi:lactonase family protein [Planotetraspora sp. A-T 1434]|uniref:lactonase family protein n=1 Tax=Planotetraspora sp. A-T 1434 TaxID=2979219 RepID=UPI0021BFE31D|nr:lactonase family protein [Planotetraspora sp. A-T 1434]MCT9934241.1 lactonase family protein [Planotetraspora sp. A-T 1434]
MPGPQPGPATPGSLVIGGYTADTGGSGTGLTRVRVDAAGRLRAVAETAVSGPSFVTAHPHLPLLYAVLERPDGGVAVFADAPHDGDDGAAGTVAGAGPRLLAEHPSGGSYPCHLAVDPDGTWLAVANYGDGTVAVFRLGEDGLPEPDPLLFRNEGHGPNAGRQEGPHAHQAVFGPDGVLYVTDLGTDEVRRFLPGMTPHPDGPVRLAPGTGPRHLVHHPLSAHWYVAGELDGTVAVYDDEWRELSRVPASAIEGPNQPSHIDVSADGRHVYVGNRGPDTITAFAVERGRLTPIAEVPGGGRWPRHFAVAGDRIYVANERSDRVAVLALKDGVPEPSAEGVDVGSPSCVLIG